MLLSPLQPAALLDPAVKSSSRVNGFTVCSPGKNYYDVTNLSFLTSLQGQVGERKWIMREEIVQVETFFSPCNEN